MPSDTHTTHPGPAALRELADLPGPAGLPLIGNLLQLDHGRAHQTVERWGRDYGPLFAFRLGDRHFLGVTDHALIAAALRDRPDGFRRTMRLEQIWLEMGLEPGLFGANGDAWRRQRPMVMHAFDPVHVRAYFPALSKVALRLRGRWQRAAREHAAIDLRADLMRYTVDAITGLAFGSDVNTLESGDDIIQRHLDRIFPALMERILAPVPVWRWIKRPADRRLDRGIAEVRTAIHGFIARARERMATDPGLRERPRNLLDAMVAAADRADSSLDDRDVAGNVLTMLLAGEDTTANTLAWLLHLLACHPEALRRAEEEVHRVAPDAHSLTLEQLDALAWVQACIDETMRLKPVAPFQALQAARETAVADVRLPAGTLVWCVMRHDSLDDAHFGRAAEFDPARWLAEPGKAHAASSAKRVSMPFGAGPRVCPGRYLALMEMKLAVAMLLGSFDIEGVDTPDGGEPEEHLSFTMAPVGLAMRLRERMA